MKYYAPNSKSIRTPLSSIAKHQSKKTVWYYIFKRFTKIRWIMAIHDMIILKTHK